MWLFTIPFQEFYQRIWFSEELSIGNLWYINGEIFTFDLYRWHDTAIYFWEDGTKDGKISGAIPTSLLIHNYW